MSEHTRIPIIKIWHLLLVPLQGQVDDALAEQLRQDVLLRIQNSEVTGLVMDVTGLWLMDSHLCAVLSQIASAARLMGTYTVICGMAPEIALTLQTMGLELSNVGTELSLEQALARLGVGVLDDEMWASNPEAEADLRRLGARAGGAASNDAKERAPRRSGYCGTGAHLRHRRVVVRSDERNLLVSLAGSAGQ